MDANEIDLLIRRVLSGDSREFSRLVKEFGLPVRSFIHSRVRNPDDAEDLAQEVFIAAFRGLSKFRLGESFEGWLIGIARHRVQSHFRSATRRSEIYDNFRQELLSRINTELQAAEGEYKSEQLANLMDCVDQLPERMRKVVNARLRGEDATKAAERLNTSCGAVYMLHMRANALLKDCITRRLA